MRALDNQSGHSLQVGRDVRLERRELYESRGRKERTRKKGSYTTSEHAMRGERLRFLHELKKKEKGRSSKRETSHFKPLKTDARPQKEIWMTPKNERLYKKVRKPVEGDPLVTGTIFGCRPGKDRRRTKLYGGQTSGLVPHRGGGRGGASKGKELSVSRLGKRGEDTSFGRETESWRRRRIWTGRGGSARDNPLRPVERVTFRANRTQQKNRERSVSEGGQKASYSTN